MKSSSSFDKLGSDSIHSMQTYPPRFALDAISPTLSAFGANPGELLQPAAPPAPGHLAPPSLALGLAELGLVAGDVPNAVSFGVDALPSGVVHFAVGRSTSGFAGLFPPDVESESSSGDRTRRPLGRPSAGATSGSTGAAPCARS